MRSNFSPGFEKFLHEKNNFTVGFEGQSGLPPPSGEGIFLAPLAGSRRVLFLTWGFLNGGPTLYINPTTMWLNWGHTMVLVRRDLV